MTEPTAAPLRNGLEPARDALVDRLLHEVDGFGTMWEDHKALLREAAAALAQRNDTTEFDNACKTMGRFDRDRAGAVPLSQAIEELGRERDELRNDQIPRLVAIETAARAYVEKMARTFEDAEPEFNALVDAIDSAPFEIPRDEDARRLDAIERFAHGTVDITICPPGNHGGEPGNWLFAIEDSVMPCRTDEYEGPTIRAAIDQALELHDATMQEGQQ